MTQSERNREIRRTRSKIKENLSYKPSKEAIDFEKGMEEYAKRWE